ncbi:light-harvesting protein [Phaeovulum vinaykumarii]|uniref:Antenna pigment protein alpha chain n=1 Tax=Phaeovulum vinaykumarii TaxID=407234 RepID=A0A1N7M426_9RHOB|nr:light-harvesting protein [Phaeovulum vinaykumarii]SIS80865.1 light-harvesting protein B-800-850 alpha chain [Phaeovulum vinaykumarii]SOC08882.1 light-harvesting protein B-800-850 alpha chain [Phaeovulum vinaykumarii]
MNNAKMWLVVKPTVGVPLFLAAVAVSSFAVHYMIVTNTTWLGKYYNGSAAAVEAPVEVAAS